VAGGVQHVDPDVADLDALAVREKKLPDNWQTFNTQISSPSAKIMLPLYTYPGLVTKVNGVKVKTEIDPDLGRVIVSVPTGYSLVTAKIGYTAVRLLSDLLTLSSAIIFISLWKKWKTK